MSGFKSVLVGLVLAILIIAFGHFVLHIPEGMGRLALAGVAAIVFLVFAFGPGNLWGKGGTLNSFVFLALLNDSVVPIKAQAILVITLLFVWLVARNSTRVYPNANAYYSQNRKWYKNPTFSLLPLLVIKTADEHNTGGFSFDWLFLRVWTLDAVGFELAVVADSHWGVGINGILPYLRWVCCVPCPERLGMWLQANTWRKPKPELSSSEGLVNTAC
jgi:hypothetical protein